MINRDINGKWWRKSQSAASLIVSASSQSLMNSAVIAYHVNMMRKESFLYIINSYKYIFTHTYTPTAYACGTKRARERGRARERERERKERATERASWTAAQNAKRIRLLSFDPALTTCTNVKISICWIGFGFICEFFLLVFVFSSDRKRLSLYLKGLSWLESG